MALIYIEYDVLSKQRPGWTLTEIKRMPSRERQHWLALENWRQERAMV